MQMSPCAFVVDGPKIILHTWQFCIWSKNNSRHPYVCNFVEKYVPTVTYKCITAIPEEGRKEGRKGRRNKEWNSIARKGHKIFKGWSKNNFQFQKKSMKQYFDSQCTLHMKKWKWITMTTWMTLKPEHYMQQSQNKRNFIILCWITLHNSWRLFAGWRQANVMKSRNISLFISSHAHHLASVLSYPKPSELPQQNRIYFSKLCGLAKSNVTSAEQPRITRTFGSVPGNTGSPWITFWRRFGFRQNSAKLRPA